MHRPANYYFTPTAPSPKVLDASYKQATGKDWDPLAVFAEAVKALKEKPCAKPS